MTYPLHREPYYVQTGSAWENPYGIPHDELERMEQELPAEVVAQTIYGMFVEMSGVVFSAEIANELFDHDLPKVMGDHYIDMEAAQQVAVLKAAKRLPEFRYAHGIDLARKKDYTVITTLDTATTPARCVYWRRINRVPWARIYAEIGRAVWLFPGEHLVDSTGSGGDVVMDELLSRLYCAKHHVAFEANQSCPQYQTAGDHACKRQPGWMRLNPEGFAFGPASKVQLINHLQQAMSHGYDPNNIGKRFGAIRMPPINQLMEEIQEYQWEDKKLDTDCVMSLALAAWKGVGGFVGDPVLGSAFGN